MYVCISGWLSVSAEFDINTYYQVSVEAKFSIMVPLLRYVLGMGEIGILACDYRKGHDYHDY